MNRQALLAEHLHIHRNDRLEVSEGRVLQSNFTLPRPGDMTDSGVLCTHSKRAPPKREANPVSENGAWHIVFKDISSPPGSTSTAQVARLATRSRANPALPHRDARSRSRSLRTRVHDAHDAPAARRDVRDAPALRIMRPVPKLRAPTRHPLRPSKAAWLLAGAVKPCAESPAPTMS